MQHVSCVRYLPLLYGLSNGRQNTTQKTRNWGTLKTWSELRSGAPDGSAVPGAIMGHS